MILRLGIPSLAAVLLIAPLAQANVYTVGSDGACTHTSITEALAAAEAHAGADTIRIASNRTYTQQAIAFETAQPLDLAGGFADCSQGTSDGSLVSIEGAPAQPVFRITVDTGGLVRISNVTVRFGNAVDGRGGGIYFKGNGTLELHHSTITQNFAGSGGGIYAEGSGAATKLVIGEDVAILGNTARFSGGGVVNDGVTMTMTAPDSYIANNHVLGDTSLTEPSGFGGGLFIRAHGRKATTILGSSGFGTVGAIYLNDALYGGGIAVGADDNLAELDVYSTDPARPMRINGNNASVSGGGIYLGNYSGDLPMASLNVWYAYVDDNTAPEGAAIDVRTRQGTVYFNDAAHRPTGAIDCPTGKPCGAINNNAAIDDSSQPSGGIVNVTSGGTLRFNRIEFRDNTGFNVFRNSLGNEAVWATRHVAIIDNSLAGSVIAVSDGSGQDGFVDIQDTTIAGNTISGTFPVLQLNSAVGVNRLYRSIVWQPGKTTLFLKGSGPRPDLLDDMISDRPSLDPDGTASVIERDPRFTDPARGDYSLRGGSPAIDYAASVANDGQDLESNPRDIDIPVIGNFHGKRDLGAIEKQTLQPLVLNSDFDVDFRFWSEVNAGATTWDNTRNASGASGSGSAHMMLSNAATGAAGLTQCVLIPGPGVYTLNGWGRGTGTMVTAGDIAELYWEFRKSGGENCTSGAPNATGTHVLSNSPNWTRPATPATIVVTPQDFTSTSSIAVTTIAVENGPSGGPTNAWFDGITLGIEGEDTIFANGFEP